MVVPAVSVPVVSVVMSLFVACLSPPVSGGTVVEHFQGPPCEFCAGHRGLEYALDGPAAVVAAAAGIVTFTGSVAGVRYVVVRHDTDDLLATYGMLDVVDVRVDDRVIAGQRLGAVDDRLYFGLRRDGRYIDPEPLLGTVIRRPRLVPVDGSAGRSAEPGHLRCTAVPARKLVVRPARSMLSTR